LLWCTLDGAISRLWASQTPIGGGNRPDRRSTSGYVYLIGGTALSWSSTRQKSVSLSTTEAEYIASSGATQELIWLRRSRRSRRSGRSLGVWSLTLDVRLDASQRNCLGILSLVQLLLCQSRKIRQHFVVKMKAERQRRCSTRLEKFGSTSLPKRRRNPAALRSRSGP
jgi:hypothetical protein